MSFLWGGAILLLVLGIYRQWRAGRTRSAHLHYLTARLASILEKQTNGRVLIFAADPNLQALLVEINRVLDQLQHNTAQHIKVRESMRRMLSNIAHDLKTPLTVIMGYLETLSLDPDSLWEKPQIVLEKAYSKAQELQDLLNRFFDLALLEAGDWELALSKVNLSEVARKSILSFFDLLVREGLEVVVKIPDEDIYIIGNEEAVGRIIGNLIDNAAKYGKEGKRLGLTLSCQEDCACLEVWDQGQGIPLEEQGRVFDRLYTLEDARSRYLQGSGLGLAIVKRLMEMMGGSITLFSEAFVKTAFTCNFKRVLF